MIKTAMSGDILTTHPPPHGTGPTGTMPPASLHAQISSYARGAPTSYVGQVSPSSMLGTKRKRSEVTGDNPEMSPPHHHHHHHSSSNHSSDLHGLGSKRHKLSKPSSIPQLHASNSGTQNNTYQASSPNDRKRNKLGYHRTTIACAHCRRRKIRCLIPQEETSGRCTNCIRLKKECTFTPVEQSQAHKHNPIATPRHNSGASAGSPATAYPYPGSNQGHVSNYTTDPPTSRSNEMFHFAGTTQPGLGIYGTTQGPSESIPAQYGNPSDPRTQAWSTGYPGFTNYPAPITQAPLDVGNQTWKTTNADAPIYGSQYLRPHYTPYTSAPASTSPHVGVNVATAPLPEAPSWGQPPPPRSMSIVNSEHSLSRRVSPQTTPKTQHNLSASRRTSAHTSAQNTPHPPAPHRMLSDHSSTTTISEPTPGPMPPAGSHAPVATYYQPPWTPYPGHDQQYAEPRVYDEQTFDQQWSY